MKKFISLAILSVLLTFSFSTYAQEAVEQISKVDFLMALIESIGGMKGAGTLAIVAAVIQLLLKFFKTEFASFAGKYKLLVVYGLSMVSGVVALVMQGMDLGAALLHSNTLAAFQVFGNQLYKQFFVKSE